MPTEYQEMVDRYVTMSTDDLLHFAGDSESLTTAAREVLAKELQKRGLDSPSVVAKYQLERDQQTEHAAQVHCSKLFRLQKIFDHLREHPVVAFLASAGFPALSLLIGYGMVTLKAGNGRILSFLVSLALALGGVCGVATARSQASLAIRTVGILAALAEFFYAFVFLFSAAIGFR